MPPAGRDHLWLQNVPGGKGGPEPWSGTPTNRNLRLLPDDGPSKRQTLHRRRFPLGEAGGRGPCRAPGYGDQLGLVEA